MASEQKGTQRRLEELEREISALPRGSVTKKTINGREYFYHRWTEDKKRREKYIPAKEADALREQIEQRKQLEKEWKSLGGHNSRSSAQGGSASEFSKAVRTGGDKPRKAGQKSSEPDFFTVVRTGAQLRSFSAPVRHFRKRECFSILHDYIYGDVQDRVLILYGLRRTGKTTLIRQIFAEMDEASLNKAAFIQAVPGDTLAKINHDLRLLEQQGFRYIFLDEATLMEDFIEGAALFADIFASCGMKIVLSGTDSLGFLFAEDEQLYDRCILIHTTFIPYREFESVLGIRGIDEYIRYGGTMSQSGRQYNETSPFAGKKTADEYVDTAIARNIQHSLRCYQHEGHFRHLQDLYEQNELTGAINRVVEDINHRFTLEVLTRDFRSHDLGISASNLRRDRENPTDILDRIDLPRVTENLRTLLEIRNKPEQTVQIDDVHAAEIREYLDLLDLTQDIDVRHLPDIRTKGSRTVIAQPGLRYAQAKALILSLLEDETFLDLSLAERQAVQERILSEIRGRMMEDILLLETKTANPKKEVFVLQFPIGEFDMVIFDPEEGCCQIAEIKHSTKTAPQQYRHLIDEEKCRQTAHRYGPITRKFVLYRGETMETDGILYQNVEEYLRKLTA